MKVLREWFALPTGKDLLDESRSKNNGRVMLSGVVQRADTLNQNGRIYPLDILSREIENYQKLIRENRAVGECVPPGTEIYTKDGWKQIQSIDDHELVLTFSEQNNRFEFIVIDERTKRSFGSRLTSFLNENDSPLMTVTPNHGIIFWDKDGKLNRASANEIAKILNSDERNLLDGATLRCNSQLIVDDEGSTGDIALTSLKAVEIDYTGDVFCVRNKNRSWVMRQKYLDRQSFDLKKQIVVTSNCDHPQESVVSLKSVSHIVRELRMDGNDVYGTIELLPTPNGKILETLIESGVQIGISSRGVGSTKRENNADTVQDDYQIICWDCVQDPSTPQAFLHRELSESIDPMDVRRFFTRSDKIDRLMNDIIASHKKREQQQ